MTGEGGSVDVRMVAETAVSLRRLLAAIDAGKLAASEAQRASLAGALDALGQLAHAAPEVDEV